MRISSRIKNRIKFNNIHTNYKNNKGIYVPSVTTILKVLAKDDALMIWSNNLGWQRKSYKKELENSSSIGTTAHAFCEYALTGDKELLNQINDRMKNFDEDSYNQTKNAIISFKKWFNKNKKYIEVIGIEMQLTCNEYGGTADLVCKYRDKLMVIDFKTSSSFYLTQFLQLSSYAKMYSKRYNKRIEDVAVLRLDKKNGDIAKLLRLSKLPNGNLKYYQFVFDKIVKLYKYNNVLNNDWNGYKSLLNNEEIFE